MKRLLPLVLPLALAACGGGSSSDPVDDIDDATGTSTDTETDTSTDTSVDTLTDTDTDTATASSTGFPQDLSVSSPVAHTAMMTSMLRHSSSVESDQASVDAVLEDPTTLATTLDVNAFFMSPGRAESCYGPNLLYSEHPDGVAGNSGELPSGDLGLWIETAADDDEDGIAEACAAAHLNARMNGMESRSLAALMVLAAVKGQYDADGTTDISAHLPAGVTASDDSLSVSSDGTTTTTMITLMVDHDSSGSDETIDISLVHYENADDSSNNEGILTLAVADSFNGGNCGAGANDIVRYSSVHYIQSSENNLVLQAREANACASTTMAFNEAAEAVNGEVSGYVLDPDSGWADNFSVFTAEFDPSPDSSGELEGRFTYVWQAGNGDSHTRVLDIGLGAGVGGESWFGFGHRVQDVADASEFGIISGMICNWAGPGGSHAEQPYAQRQHLTLDSSVGFYVPSNSAASDITYAPTTSCMYDGTGSFDYDRNLDGTLDGIDVVAVGEDYATLSLGLDFDLMMVGDGRADIWETIINDRNFRLPAYPQ